VGWEPSREIFDPGLDNQILGAQILVERDGTLLAFFNKIISVNPDRLTVIRSRDKGETWDVAKGGTEIAQILANGTVTPDTGDAVRDAAILFDVAIDPHNDRLYAVWQDFRFTGFDQIAFSQSKDSGKSWSAPIRVNATPANTRRPFKQQALLPSVAVAGNGTVIVSYYDLRNDIVGPRELTDHFMVFCNKRCDQSKSWRSKTRLTEASFDYAKAPVARGPFIGDYLGLAARGDQVVAFFPQAVSENDSSSMFSRRIFLDDDDDRKKGRRHEKDDDDDDKDRRRRR